MFVFPVLCCHEVDVLFRSKSYCSRSRVKYFVVVLLSNMHCKFLDGWKKDDVETKT